METLLEKIQKMLAERKHLEQASCPITTPIKTHEKLLIVLPPELRPLYFLQHEIIRQSRFALSALTAWRIGNSRFNTTDTTSPLFKEYLKFCHGYTISLTRIQVVITQFSAELNEIITLHRPEPILVAMRADWQMVEVDITTENTEDMDSMLMTLINPEFSRN